MKTFKYILIFILGLVSANSCLVDDTTKYDLNDDGPNLAGFELNRTMVSGIADGTEYDFNMKVKIAGPTKTDLVSDITLTIGVDEAAMTAAAAADTTLTPAVEGVHYRIDDPTAVLTAYNDYLGLINITMLTQGLATPLPKTPFLVLETISATGDSKVTNNGKSLEITMNFACFSEFQGTYNVTTTSSSGVIRSWTETITKIGTEQYLTQRVGTWDPPLNPNYGFIFNNACNVLSVPSQDLADMYSNEVWGHKPGYADPETGVLTIYYTIWFAAGNSEYTAVYIPVP